jgi:hypothetical protein
MGQDGTGVHCTVQGCNSAFDNESLYGKIDSEIYDLYVKCRVRQEKLDKIIAGMDTLRLSNSMILHNLAYLATEEVKKCPTLVWLEPVNPKIQNDWCIPWAKKTYKLYFICEKSFQVIEPAIEIKLSREWVVKIAPILCIGLFLLRTAANSQGIPFPFRIKISTMEGMVKSLLDDETKKLLHEANTSFIDFNKETKVFSLVRTAHEMISEIANQPTNTQWKEQMEPCLLEKQKLIWVKKEFVPVSSHSTWV